MREMTAQRQAGYVFEELDEGSEDSARHSEALLLFVRRAAESTEGIEFFRVLINESECLLPAPYDQNERARHEGRRDVGLKLLNLLDEAGALGRVLCR